MEVAKTKTIVQTLVKPDAASKVWKEYIEEAFPWVKEGERQEHQALLDVLRREVSMGPIRVAQVFDRERDVRSRLRTKQVNPADTYTQVNKKILSRLPRNIPR